MNENKAPLEFLESLRPGDWVAATVPTSYKLHLIRFERRVGPEEFRGKVDEHTLQQSVKGQVLCSMRPRYWWKPTDQHEHWKTETKCWHCFRAWVVAGRPQIRGWAKPEQEVQSDVRLPWGWHEVTPSGHALDLPETAPEPTEDEPGERRVEVRRWVRGTRYVRITRSFTDNRHALRYGQLDARPEDEACWLKGSYEGILVAAVTCMALGGHATRSTRYDKLQMRDVALKGVR